MLTVLSRPHRPAALATLLGTALLLAGALPGQTGPRFLPVSAATPSYLALGDSLAAGLQPDASGRDHVTSQGYADVLGRRLARVYPGLRTIKVSCGGATTGTLLRGGAGCQRSGEPSQLVQAERALRAHADVRLVTVNIGDNDVEGCVHLDPPSIDDGCVADGRAAIGRNLPQIAHRLAAAAGPRTAVVGITDYDQFLALWNEGPAGRAVARRSVRVIGSLNALMARIYRQAGIAVASSDAAFATTNLSTMRSMPGYGRVPLAVERICRWTWACSPPPIGHDDHARPHGYAVIAQSVLDALAAGGR